VKSIKELQQEVAEKHNFAIVAGWASIATVIVLIIFKTMAWLASGSTSILASLIDSIVDGSVSLMNFFAIRLSLKPADYEHRHGHGKIEGLAALLQGAFITGAAVFLIFEAISRFLNAEAVTEHWLGIAVMVFATIASIGLVYLQNHVLTKAPSLAVEADQAHFSSDIIMNIGVIIVLIILNFGGPSWVDPLFALLIAGILVKTAWEIVNKGLDMLLDKELPDNQREKILQIARAHPDIRSVHDLRTRKSGMRIYISFDVEIDADMTLRDAHAISLDVEKSVHKEFPNAEIMIHKDPYGVPHEESRHHNISKVSGK
jgi:ferrous-iron efflux pump FieF